jgi:hypothetical protein
VTTALLGGSRVFLLDNVRGRLDCTLLESMATEPVVSLRRLGTSEDVTVDTRRLVLITANNCQMQYDLLRRCLRACLKLTL